MGELFSNDYMPHGMCYLWRPGVLWLNVISDALIAAAYYAIPLVLFQFAKRRKDLRLNKVFVAFGLFILACGSTHLLEVVNVWQAYYPLAGWVKAVTAAASIATVVLLVPLVPAMIAMPSPAQLQRMNRDLEREVEERKVAEAGALRINNELERRVAERTAELEHSNRKLRESIDRYRFLADAMPEIVWTSRPDGVPDYFNRRWYEYTGQTSEPPGEDSLASVLHPDDAATVRERWRGAVDSGGLFQTEYRLCRAADRAWRWHLGRALPRRDESGAVVQWVGTATDIDDQKRAEQELRLANRELAILIDTSPLGIYRLDREGRVTSWSTAAERIFGFTREQAIGQFPPFLLPDEIPDYQDTMDCLRRGAAVVAKERRRRRADGKSIDISVWASPLHGADGSIRGAVCVVADLTDRKRLAEQLLQAQKMEGIGRLAGGVAHDFNNLLTAIAGYNDLLREEVGANPRLLEYSREVQAAADRATALTGQLLAFSRRQVTQPAIIDLNVLVRNIEKMLARIIGEDVQLQTRLAADVPKVLADPANIDQVILNLAVNARDAMPRGGRLLIETASVVLTPEDAGRHFGVPPGRYAVLAVSDTGNGMDVETKRRLFEPFFTTKEQGKGTGLGLAIVYGIVKQNGGEILVYSEPGQGATFKIYLPEATAQPQDAAAERHAKHIVEQGNETVLVVEDEEGVRRLAAQILRKRGYQVLEAGSASEALDIAARRPEPIHVLLTDIVMPGMNGVEMASAVAELRPDVKVLYMSGYTDAGVIHQGMLMPGAAYIQKPFTAASLAGAVRRVLES